MPQQNIFLGSAPNDGTGTKPRPAGQVINENFSEVYAGLAAQGTRLNGVESFTASGTGAVARPLASVLNDTVDVRNYGADATGNADSTAAFLAAFATGKPVVATGQFKLSGSVAFTANGQWLVGHGCRLVPVGNFDVFTIGGGLEGCGMVGVRVEGNQMTGGNFLYANHVGRFILRDMVVWSPWNFAWLQRFNYVSYESVWVNNIRGIYGTTAFGDNVAGKSDVLRMVGVNHSGSSANKPHGLIVNGAVHTVSLQNVAMVNANRGVWVTNTANAGILPLFIFADDLQVDFPQGECVRLEVGAYFWFTNCYMHGSATASGLYVGPSVSADTVHVTSGLNTGHARYGIENSVRVRMVNTYFQGNALGDISAPGSVLLRTPRVEIDPNFYGVLSAGNPIWNVDANDYLTYNRELNRWGFAIAGAPKFFVSETEAEFTVPVEFKGYTTALLPAASSSTGSTVRVTDKAHRLATSDGTNWRFTDGSDVVTGGSGGGGGTSAPAFEPADYRAAVETVAGNYTVVGADNNKIKVVNGPTGNTTSDVVVSLTSQPVGTTIRFVQGGSNRLSFESASGAAQGVNAIGAAKRSNGQHGNVVATVTAANTWVLSGNLAA